MPVTEVQFFYRAYRQPPTIVGAAPMVYPTRGIGGETMWLAYAYTTHNDRTHVVAVFSNEVLEHTVEANSFSLAPEAGSSARSVVGVERLATHVYRLSLDGPMTIGSNNYTLTAATSIRDIFLRQVLSTRRTWIVSGPDVCSGEDGISEGSMILWPLLRAELSRDGSDTAALVLRTSINGTAEDLPFPSLTANRWYWMSGDQQTDADGGVEGRGDLVRALFSTMIGTHSLAGAAGAAVTLSSTNRITAAVNDGNTIDLQWAHANTTLSALPFGWAQTSTGAAVSQAAPRQTYGAWTPNRSDGNAWVPQIDSRNIAQHNAGGVVSLAGYQHISYLGPSAPIRNIEWHVVPDRWAISEYADTTEPTGTAEDVFYAAIRNRPVRYYEDRTLRTSTSYGLYFARAEELTGALDQVVMRDPQWRTRWRVKLPLRAYA